MNRHGLGPQDAEFDARWWIAPLLPALVFGAALVAWEPPPGGDAAFVARAADAASAVTAARRVSAQRAGPGAPAAALRRP